MLNLDEEYQENKSGFDEINSNIEKMGMYSVTSPQKPEIKEEKLSNKTRLIMFLCGFSYFGFLILQIFWGIVFENFIEDELTFNVATISALYFSLFGIMMFIAIKNKDYFKNKIKDPTKYLYGLIYGIATIGIEIAVSYLITTLFPTETNANQATVIEFASNYPTLMFFVIVLIGPLCEELTYRVGLYELIKDVSKNNDILAIILSSLVFAFIHISFTETTVAAELASFPIYLTIGVCFTFAYKKFGLPCSYICHVLINLLSFWSIVAQL